MNSLQHLKIYTVQLNYENCLFFIKDIRNHNEIPKLAEMGMMKWFRLINNQDGLNIAELNRNKLIPVSKLWGSVFLINSSFNNAEILSIEDVQLQGKLTLSDIELGF